MSLYTGAQVGGKNSIDSPCSGICELMSLLL